MSESSTSYSPVSPRPTWDETWLAVAHTVARRSLCVRDQVGAVIVNDHNRVVSVGYNGPPAGLSTHGRCAGWCPRANKLKLGDPPQLDPEYDDCYSLHAEANALSVCDRSLRVGGTIYITSAVCFGCAKLVANSGLARLVVSLRRPVAPHRNSDRSYEFLRDSGVRVFAHATG